MSCLEDKEGEFVGCRLAAAEFGVFSHKSSHKFRNDDEIEFFIHKK